MAESKAKDAPKDPTITSGLVGDEYPEGTHPARAASEVTHSVGNLKYQDNPDKPDPSTVAQVQVVQPDNAQAR